MQRGRPRYPRHRRAGAQLILHRKQREICRVRHKLHGTGAFSLRSVSSTQLTTNVQIVAGIISLHNDYLLSVGKAPLGFLNPWLYAAYDVGLLGLNDITSGSNPGCGTEGFSATAGWDPVRPARLSIHFRGWLIFGSAVTGLGTPDFLNLLATLDYID